MSQPVLRFAPSPNGLLHLGHAYSALLNQDMARQLGGRLVLRLDDNDRGRWRAEHETDLLRDLEWIGFEWHGAPVRLSESREACDAALAELQDRGMLFRSRLSRKSVQDLSRQQDERHKRYGEPAYPRDPDGVPHHPKISTNIDVIAEDQSFSWRLDMTAALAYLGADLVSWCEAESDHSGQQISRAPSMWGNAQLRNMNGDDAYAFATVLHDAALAVTHVVRGQDLLENTALQRLLQILLDLDAPHYHHHDLIRDAEGRKLSKSEDAQSLKALRDAGWTASDIQDSLEQTLHNNQP